MMNLVQALVGGFGAFISDAPTLEDLALPHGTAIIDANGLVWQNSTPEFVGDWHPADPYMDTWAAKDGGGGPKFPVRIIHMGEAK